MYIFNVNDFKWTLVIFFKQSKNKGEKNALIAKYVKDNHSQDVLTQ